MFACRTMIRLFQAVRTASIGALCLEREYLPIRISVEACYIYILEP